MKSALKILLPIAAVMGVVFLLTFLMQHVSPEPEAGRQGGARGGDRESSEPPLRFASTIALHEPVEVGRDGAGRFWFENRNPAEVVLQLKGVSCSACSRGTVTVIPPETARLILQMTALGTLPLGPVTPLPLGLAAPAARLDAAALPGVGFKFMDHPDATYTIPPAAPAPDPGNPDKWAAAPQWGVLELGFTARPPAEPRTLSAAFAAAVKAPAGATAEFKFETRFQVVTPFEVSPPAIDVGEIGETTPPRTAEVVAYSVTRSPAEMPPPRVFVRVPLGHPPVPAAEKCVTASPPELMTRDELARWAETQGRPGFLPKCAYRTTVTVARQAGGSQLDVGALEREVWVMIGEADADQKKATVKGSVRGSVWLAKGTALDLGNFRALQRTTEQFELVTEKAGAELAVVKELTRPEFLEIALEKQPDRGDRGAYKVKVTVPPGRQFGEFRDGSLTLELKGGPTPQRIRLPIKGRGIGN